MQGQRRKLPIVRQDVPPLEVLQRPQGRWARRQRQRL